MGEAEAEEAEEDVADGAVLAEVCEGEGEESKTAAAKWQRDESVDVFVNTEGRKLKTVPLGLSPLPYALQLLSAVRDSECQPVSNPGRQVPTPKLPINRPMAMTESTQQSSTEAHSQVTTLKYQPLDQRSNG